MNSNLLNCLLYGGIVLLLSMAVLLIPLPVLAKITAPFTCRTFGIRKIRRWNNHTDTLANFFLWVSLIFCLLFPFIPYFQVFYALWLTFAWLAALSRAVRLSEVKETWKRLTVIFFLNLMFGTGLVCGLGQLNYYGLIRFSHIFAADLESKAALHFMYYMSNPAFMCYLCQLLVMFIPLFSLWSQFKYMRLENSFKSRFIGMYVAKEFVIVAVVALLGTTSLGALENLYNIPREEQMSQGYESSREKSDSSDETSQQGNTSQAQIGLTAERSI